MVKYVGTARYSLHRLGSKKGKNCEGKTRKKNKKINGA
jgi:hypothetical protein